MCKRRTHILLLFFVSGLVACAGTGKGVKYGKYTYSANVGQGIGNVTLDGFRRITYDVLEGKYQYNVLRFREVGSRITFETEWLNRAPFKDEAELGARQARTKIYGEAKYLRLTASGDTKVTALSFTGENMLQSASSGDWELKPITPDCKKYLRECFNKFENEVISKMRTF